MAFTPDGMFYLSEKDLEPTIGLAGTGVRGMLGLQNKKEAVDSLMQSGDFSTPESRRSILEQIRAIDPTAYTRLAKENQDWEATELKLQTTRNKPQLTAQWTYQAKDRSIANWLKINIGGAIPDSVTRGQASKIIRAKSEADTSYNASDLQRALDSATKANRETFMSSNALNDFGGTSQTRGLAMPAGSGFEPKDKATINGEALDVPTDAGYAGTTGVSQVDPESSGFGRYWQGEGAKIDVNRRVGDMFQSIKPAIFGSLTLSKAEEDLNIRHKPAANWYGTKGRAYFYTHTKELANAEKNPLLWYEKNKDKLPK